AGLETTAEVRTQGTIVSVTDGIVRVHGLSGVMQGEMLEFPGNTFGLALNLERDSVGAVVLGEYERISEGDTVKCTGRDRTSLGEPAGADRPEVDRRDGADRPWPARADHWRPPDRQDRRGCRR